MTSSVYSWPWRWWDSYPPHANSKTAQTEMKHNRNPATCWKIKSTCEPPLSFISSVSFYLWPSPDSNCSLSRWVAGKDLHVKAITKPFFFSRIFSLLSAILHLGNIRYKKKTYRDDSIDICNPEGLPIVSELLEVSPESRRISENFMFSRKGCFRNSTPLGFNLCPAGLL